MAQFVPAECRVLPPSIMRELFQCQLVLLSSCPLHPPHTMFASNFLISQFPFFVSLPKLALFRIGLNVTTPLALSLEPPVPSLAGQPPYSAKARHNKHSSSGASQ